MGIRRLLLFRHSHPHPRCDRRGWVAGYSPTHWPLVRIVDTPHPAHELLR